MAGGAPIDPTLGNGLGLDLTVAPQPVLTIQSDDKSWVGTFVSLDIVCVSLNSDVDAVDPGLQNSFVVDTVNINVVDECSSTLINPSEVPSTTTTLYRLHGVPFGLASQNLDCSAPEYTLNPISSTSPDPTNCYLDGPQVVIDPREDDDAGLYTFTLTTCVEYVVNASLGTTAQRCEESEPFTITVNDPCDIADIYSAGFTFVMSKPQMQSDSLLYSEQIIFENGAGTFPWFTSVDVTTDGEKYGTSLCGPIVYSVEPVDQNDPTLVDLVALEPTPVNPYG